ncbi:hypothetical protein [Novosphingobium aureum]|uniref:hypothetical protein n=1 Tax=Novosphingobium aureum TaxID=2792964 RepID=UPI001E3CD1B9|nr:hypothetical protein [Novosphingobium aureum]
MTTLIVLATSVSMPALAAAQDVAAPVSSAAGAGQSEPGIRVDDDDPVEVIGNEIVVTAPAFRGIVDVPQQPIMTFEEEDIAAYGASSIAELIEAISPQTGSGRGRGSGRPVMLVNGQRITSWREMRSIPPEAIARMEILPEEVALRFGYSADLRVINLILKDNFAAVTGAGEYNRPTRGGYDNYELEGGIFKIAGPRRYNFSTKLTETSMLTEDERDIRREDDEYPTVAGDPDPTRYRSLASRSSELEMTATMTQGVGEGGLDGQVTVNGGYTRSVTHSLSGLDTFTLTDQGGNSEIRTYDDPLASRVQTDTFEASLGYNTQFGDWQFSATGDGSYTETNTRNDRSRGADIYGDLQDAAAAGEFDIAGALPVLPSAGIDQARNRVFAGTSMATLAGTPFRMPGGDASLTIKAGYDYSRTMSEDTRSTVGDVTLSRGDVSGGLNLALPLTSRDEDFLGAIGDLSLNLSGGLNELSDFGTLANWTAGLTWSPTDTLSFQGSYIVEEAAPTLAQLGAPQIVSYNVSVYDFVNQTTALVDVTSGGNPNLRKETRHDIKLSANWQLPILDRSNLLVEFFKNRSSDVTQSFPMLTPAIEAAFPDRVERDAYGNLVALDQRAVTYDRIASSSIRWGFNVGGRIGPDPRAAREAAASSGSARAPGTPAAQENGAARSGGASGGPSGGFDPARMEKMRAALCAPVQPGQQPDLSSLPAPMLERLKGEDGQIDPAKLERAKQRFCAADGAAPGSAGPGGPPPGFDPARFAKLRETLCTEGREIDPATLPERMRERLVGADGKVDPVRLAQAKERICAAPASGGQAASGEAGQEKASGNRQRSGGGMPFGRGGPPGGRWNLSLYHTWRFTDEVRIAPGSEVLDQLSGDAIASGGVPRHAIEAEGGFFYDGYGLRMKADWEAPSRVNGTGLPGSSDLRFGSTFKIDLRFFADLGRNESLVRKVPFLEGARLSLTVDNVLDQRQKVTDDAGEIPIAYQRAYREPQGRVIGLDFRKLF